ncbi:hypothetical protein [Vibrio metoecus]|uniref:hypothetical protein n=1 Tax=Vibrio metoecus TaxID=1481663 RepID=UPI000BA96AD7|nr:hypothetical protein [Vibrio metoecus]PAR34005.1 hypothetical protein CGT97_18325 [Vibrio metoecus]PAR41658.1 hypothetical protein CGT96_16340 [Vibrio metoecus]
MDVNLAEKLIADVLTTKFGCEFEPVPSSQYPRHLNFRSEDYHFSFPANLLYEAGSDVIYSENGEIMPDSVIAEE